jgi:hypothetical protein
MITDPPLNQLYDEGRQLFLSGKHREAVERFKRIYELDSQFRDVAEIVDDYYSSELEAVWLEKYQARFEPSKPHGQWQKDSLRFYIILIIIVGFLLLKLFGLLNALSHWTDGPG